MGGFLSSAKPWYKKTSGISLLILSLIIFAGAVGFAGTTFYYWLMIREGKTITLQNTGAFTSDAPTQFGTSVDRSKLETTVYPVLGHGKTVIVEFIDYKCPNCKLEYKDIEKVAAKYGSKVKIMIRDFPAESLHPGTTDLTKIARCANKQGRFIAVHNYLFEHQDDIGEQVSEENLQSLVSATGLDRVMLSSCLADSKLDNDINDDYFFAAGEGVRGTPTFFVNGEKIEGAVPFQSWQKYLDSIQE